MTSAPANRTWLHSMAQSTCARVRPVGNAAGAPPLALTQWLGAPWPKRVGEVSIRDDRAVLCLGPTDWLALASAPNSIPPTIVGDEHWVAIDQGDALAAFTLDDPRADTVLACVCALDFRAARWSATRCARTRVAGVGAVLWKQSETRWLVLVAASHREYVPRALAAACSGDGENSRS